jgi:glycosyltransferase involved in cell wall biosynthesis
MPLYNKANFVRKTIESVLSQTFKDFEIIIVNDGSTDNSLEVVREISDPRIHIFTKENEGVSSARNFGIEKAQYEYIAFLDADDIWLPDYLETIKEMIQQYPQVGIFGTGYTSIYPNKKYDRILSRFPRGEIILIENYCKSLLKKEIRQLWTGTVCIKKELFSKTGGFRIGVKRGEDLDMWLRLSLITLIVWKNESKALYLVETENNVMAGYNGEYFSYKTSFPYWEWYSINNFFVKLYASRILWSSVKKAFRFKQYKEMKQLILKTNWLYVLLGKISNKI